MTSMEHICKIGPNGSGPAAGPLLFGKPPRAAIPPTSGTLATASRERIISSPTPHSPRTRTAHAASARGNPSDARAFGQLGMRPTSPRSTVDHYKHFSHGLSQICWHVPT